MKVGLCVCVCPYTQTNTRACSVCFPGLAGGSGGGCGGGGSASGVGGGAGGVGVVFRYLGQCVRAWHRSSARRRPMTAPR